VLDTKNYMNQVNLIELEMWMQSNKVAPYYGNSTAGTISPQFIPRFSQQQIDTTPIRPNAMDEIQRLGYINQHDISLSGGNGKTSYFLSGNYLDQKGILIGSDYKRYNSRINIDQIISDKVKAGINFITSNSLSHTTGTGGMYQAGGIISAALYYPAYLPLQNPDGSYPLNPRYTSVPNPLSYQLVDNVVHTSRLLTSGYVELEVIKDLKARGNFSYDQSSSRRDAYLPSTFSASAANGGAASKAGNNSNISLMEYMLTYIRDIGKNQTLNAFAGYSYNILSGDNIFASNQNFVTDAFSYYNLAAGQSAKPGVGSGNYKNIWASYVARVIYNLRNKYTLQASFRRDGSDKFAEKRKWGNFFGASASWLISDEHFMASMKPINLLKLRVSYGELGNSNLGANAFAAYGLVSSPLFGTGTPSTAISLTQANNPNLTWETAGDFNLGVDFGFFDNKISGSVDYFNKTIRNLLSYVPFPPDFTVGGVWSNAGSTRSVGYDIGLQIRNIQNKLEGGVSWTTQINFSHYLNYWIKRAPAALAVLNRYVEPSGKNALFNGIYGSVSNGIYKGSNNKPTEMPDMIPGGLIIKDIHGYDANGNLTGPDGKISSADQTLLGNLDPKFNFGIGNNVSYKNFDLTIFFSGLSGKAISPYSPNGQYRIASLAALMGTFGWNTMPISLERWTFENSDGNFPTGLSDPKYGQFQNNASYWIIDRSFLRCRNITLGYTLPNSITRKQNVFSTLRVSFDLQNAFTITKYPGIDPELSQGNYYPLTRNYVLGVNVTF
jgi:TonB-linked SusC/RagA family outer membrane protein